MGKMGKPSRKGNYDPHRQAKVKAAIRHAEIVARTTGTAGPIIFRPCNYQLGAPGPTVSARDRKGGNGAPLRSQQPLNPLLRDALMHVLGIAQPTSLLATPKFKSKVIPQTIQPVSKPLGNSGPTVQQLRLKRSKLVERQVPPETDPKKLASRAREAERQRAAANIPIAQPKQSVGKKTKKAFELKKSAVQVRVETASQRRLKNEAVWARNKAVRNNDDARLAHNAAVEARGADIQATRKQFRLQTFDRLLQEWQRDIDYVYRFAKIDPDAPDVVAARSRADAIEHEWSRLSALPEDHQDYFKWPSTEATFGSVGSEFGGWQAMGMLSYLGYKVGMSSNLAEGQRHDLLLRCFAINLPPLNGPAYLREWGAPGTPPRLRKIADSIASSARNAKRRRNASLQIAIAHWEADLLFLRNRLYVGKFGFGWVWPVT